MSASDNTNTIQFDWEGRDRVHERMVPVYESVRKDFPDVELQLLAQPKKVEIGFVGVPEHLRRQGIGSEVIRRVTAAADALGVNTTLSVDPRFGMKKSELNKFYSGLGFRRDPSYGDPSRRVRYPGGAKSAP